MLRISCDLKYYKYILEETRRPSSTNPKRKSNSTIHEGWEGRSRVNFRAGSALETAGYLTGAFSLMCHRGFDLIVQHFINFITFYFIH